MLAHKFLLLRSKPCGHPEQQCMHIRHLRKAPPPLCRWAALQGQLAGKANMGKETSLDVHGKAKQHTGMKPSARDTTPHETLLASAFIPASSLVHHRFLACTAKPPKQSANAHHASGALTGGRAHLQARALRHACRVIDHDTDGPITLLVPCPPRMTTSSLPILTLHTGHQDRAKSRRCQNRSASCM